MDTGGWVSGCTCSLVGCSSFWKSAALSNVSPSPLQHSLIWDTSSQDGKLWPPHPMRATCQCLGKQDPWNVWLNSALLRCYKQFPSREAGFLDGLAKAGSQRPANALTALTTEERAVACGLCCLFCCCARHWGCFGISTVDKALAWSPQLVCADTGVRCQACYAVLMVWACKKIALPAWRLCLGNRSLLGSKNFCSRLL